MVVHCSAGIGRTGTFVALDALIDRITTGSASIDVLTVFQEIRRQRLHSVQTELQYVYLHKFLAQFMRKEGLVVDTGRTNAAYHQFIW